MISLKIVTEVRCKPLPKLRKVSFDFVFCLSKAKINWCCVSRTSYFAFLMRKIPHTEFLVLFFPFFLEI